MKSLYLRISSAFFSDIPQKKFSLLWGGALAVCIFFLQATSSIGLSAAILDITIIPTDGKIGEAFRTGDFSFELLLLYGMYLIKLMALLAGSLYVIMNVYAGIQFIGTNTVMGAEAGKNTVLNAFLGFVLTVSAWIIIDIVIAFFSEA